MPLAEDFPGDGLDSPRVDLAGGYRGQPDPIVVRFDGDPDLNVLADLARVGTEEGVAVGPVRDDSLDAGGQRAYRLDLEPGTARERVVARLRALFAPSS